MLVRIVRTNSRMLAGLGSLQEDGSCTYNDCRTGAAVAAEAQKAASARGLSVSCSVERVFHPGGGYDQAVCSSEGSSDTFGADLIARPGGADLLALDMARSGGSTSGYSGPAVYQQSIPIVKQQGAEIRAANAASVAAQTAVSTPAVPPVVSPLPASSPVSAVSAAAGFDLQAFLSQSVFGLPAWSLALGAVGVFLVARGGRS